MEYTLAQKSTIAAARAYAETAHAGQTYGDHPYTKHLEDVVSVIQELVPTASYTFLVVGYLHDILEDTRIEPYDLEMMFDVRIRKSVEIITDPEGATRKDRKKILHEKIGHYAVYCGAPTSYTIECALIVKIADRIANVRSCSKEKPSLLKMYKREYPEFRSAFFKGTREQQPSTSSRQCFEDSFPHFPQWFDELDKLLGYKKS